MPVANLFSEIIATSVLVLVAGAITSKLVLSTGAAAGLTPYLVSCLVWGIGLSLGGTTGYAINPARDFGPRLAHFVLPIAGKEHSDWGYAAYSHLGAGHWRRASGGLFSTLGCALDRPSRTQTVIRGAAEGERVRFGWLRL
jgi:glycerol uptake facilitator protein